LKPILIFLAKFKTLILAFVKPLGIWGAAAIAFIDASSVPLPMDLIIAGYAWADRWHFWVYAILAGLGSALGGLVPYWLGRAGGELFLLRRINRTRFEQLRDRFERQEFLALLIPSILPPPTPWKLFVFGAGVFEMRVPNFLLAVFAGRMIRYLIEGALTVEYGPQIVTVSGTLLKRHAAGVLVGLAAVLGLIVVWAVRKNLRRKTA
jgi:membrane protein YqaA with SNARE-associated domain